MVPVASAAEPSNTVSVRVRSDAPSSVLYNDAGSVRTAGDAQESVHGTTVCKLPCKATLLRDRNYVVDRKSTRLNSSHVD